MRPFFLYCIAAGAYAQPISFGIKAGVPLTDAFDIARGGSSIYSAVDKRFTVGPTLEVRLPVRTSIVFEMLYKRLGFDAAGSVATTGNLFEFPVLLKHRFKDGWVSPYLATGASFNRLSGVTQLVSGVARGRPPELRRESTAGIVFAGGLQVKALLLKVSPEVRYTYRNSELFREAVAGLLRSNKNQLEFLVGFTF